MALPYLVDAMERHGHVDQDPPSAPTTTVGQYRHPKTGCSSPSGHRWPPAQSRGRNFPVRTFDDWNAPAPPGFLEFDLAVHHGGSLWGSMIHGGGRTGGHRATDILPG